MLRLTVSAPGGKKAEIECSDTSSFGDVKTRITEILGVPVDKQRLLCAGKERKNNNETLAAAGVTAKSKLMLMLAPGYKMPEVAPEPAASASGYASGEVPKASTEESPAKVVDSQLPLKEGSGASATPGTVRVRKGRDRYNITVTQGLHAATFGDLAQHLSTLIEVPADRLRMLCRGKEAVDADPLDTKEGTKEVGVMLLFREAFHVANDGSSWLKEESETITEVEESLAKISKRIEANLCDAETLLRLGEIGGIVATLAQGIDSVRIDEAKMADLRLLKERIKKAEEKLHELGKKHKI